MPYLPPEYRVRPSTRPDWQSAYGTERLHVIASILKQFCLRTGSARPTPFNSGPRIKWETCCAASTPAGLLPPPRQHRPACVNTWTPESAPIPPRCTEKTSDGEPGTSLVDRPSRNHLVDAIQRDMDESMAFAFDEECSLIRAATRIRRCMSWSIGCGSITTICRTTAVLSQSGVGLLPASYPLARIGRPDRARFETNLVGAAARRRAGPVGLWVLRGVVWRWLASVRRLPFGPVSILPAYWKQYDACALQKKYCDPRSS